MLDKFARARKSDVYRYPYTPCEKGFQKMVVEHWPEKGNALRNPHRATHHVPSVEQHRDVTGCPRGHEAHSRKS
jgi:hypothetical protein